MLQLDNAGLRIKRQDKLVKLNLTIAKGDFIGIYGRNGSGKSLLSEIIGGAIKVDSGCCIRSEGLSAAVVSSAERKRMLEEERYNDDSEFMEGKTDPGRSVLDILKLTAADSFSVSDVRSIVESFDISHIMERGIKFLSTGEFRKMMIVRALLTRPDIIVLDDPYTGLDIGTRRKLEQMLERIRSMTKALLIISGRLDDLIGTDRIFFLNNMSIAPVTAEKIRSQQEVVLPEIGETPVTDDSLNRGESDKGAELIRMSGVKLHYYDDVILTDINWSVRAGEHWQLAGPNGSGKSSLLSLINGDSPKAYGQDIHLFGRMRGSGETVWDIKQRIGYVSGALQREHRISQNVLSVVVSGFFDSIGLYDRPDPVQIEQAKRWCADFGLTDRLERPFDSLSEGLKRAVLIIRAIVKRPALLILDEPCQGLDDYNSGFVLAVARRVIARDHSTLLYVSHDPFYRMEEITNLLELVTHADGGYTCRESN